MGTIVPTMPASGNLPPNHFHPYKSEITSGKSHSSSSQSKVVRMSMLLQPDVLIVLTAEDSLSIIFFKYQTSE